MRLIVAGAGGRMGRALVRSIAESPGIVLVGAAGSAWIRVDWKGMQARFAGLPANGVLLSADLWALSANADGLSILRCRPATIANVAIAAETWHRSCDRNHGSVRF